MRRSRILFFFLIIPVLLLAVFVVYRNGRAPGIQSVFPAFSGDEKAAVEAVFPSGEVVRFGVYSNIFKVGEGSLAYAGTVLRGGERQQHVRMQVETLSVNDTDEVYGREDFSFPRRVERNIKLFGRAERIEEIYADDGRSVTISKAVKDRPLETQVLGSEEPLQNVLLMIYRLRNDPALDVGKAYAINLPTQKFVLSVKSRTKLKVPLGVFSVFYIESTPAKYKIWMTADPKRLPVRIQGLVSFGMVYLAATSVESAEKQP